MPRRKLHKAFLAWLKQNRSRFAIAVRPGRRNDRMLKFSFAGVNSVIQGVLNTREIEVFVIYEGDCWDILAEFDAEPRRVQGGCVCAACPVESRKIFADRLSLWTDLFEPFLKWVNDNLAEAKWLSLQGACGYATSARLLADDARELSGGGVLLDFGALVEGCGPVKKHETRRFLLPCRTGGTDR